MYLRNTTFYSGPIPDSDKRNTIHTCYAVQKSTSQNASRRYLQQFRLWGCLNEID